MGYRRALIYASICAMIGISLTYFIGSFAGYDQLAYLIVGGIVTLGFAAMGWKVGKRN